MSFVLNTPDDVRVMLETIGVSSIDQLFLDIPEDMRLEKISGMPGRLTESQAFRHLGQLASKNNEPPSFVGAGAYNHYIPAAVDHLASRSEFYTAYTPYQAEVSQGTLTAIFEFQTMICRLTGMDIANASMYDGATSLAEAVLMSSRTSRKNKIVVSETVHPHYRQVLNTYAWANDLSILEVPTSGGVSDISGIKQALTDEVGAVVVQNPAFFGCIEDVKSCAEAAHQHGAHLIVVVTEAMSLGLLKPPGELGADIVCGEGQSFGNPIGFGGPMLGLLAAGKKFMRSMPGRLIGKTVDHDGKEAYTMTLQTREQHIRRDRATSNICTNEGLCALRAAMYLSLVGTSLQKLARLNHTAASYLMKRLTDEGYARVFDMPFFNEFVIRLDNARDIVRRMEQEGFLMGLTLEQYYPDMKDCVLMAVTECTTKTDIDNLVTTLKNTV